MILVAVMFFLSLAISDVTIRLMLAFISSLPSDEIIAPMYLKGLLPQCVLRSSLALPLFVIILLFDLCSRVPNNSIGWQIGQI